jgi:molybdopterin molybdotransferase
MSREIQIQLSCADEHDPALLEVEQAQERIAARIKPVRGVERMALRAALGRVLAEQVRSPMDVPGHTNSAMDGYSVHGTDLPSEGTQSLCVIGTSWAGRPFAGPVGPGQAVRIMTGGVMPEGTDSVVMQEHVEVAGDSIRIGSGHETGQNVRQAGEDLRWGEVVLESGKRLQAAELGLLASLGIPEVSVRRTPRAAFFSTGDELRTLGETLGAGQVYDSNRYTLYAMLAQLGVETLDMGVIPDRRDAIEKAFVDAADSADVVITSGGVSVGEADYVKETLAAIGEVGFWKIAIKPGRPLAFGTVGDAVFFGLPGNPVSVMVTFLQFVQPALRHMMGEPFVPAPLSFRAPCASRLKKRPGRREYQRGFLERREDTRFVVHSTGDQGSGILSSMSRANCFIVLPSATGDVDAGTLVEVQPFEVFR